MIKPITFKNIGTVPGEDIFIIEDNPGDHSGVYTEVEHVDDLVAELEKLQTWFERRAAEAKNGAPPTHEDMTRQAVGIHLLRAKYRR